MLKTNQNFFGEGERSGGAERFVFVGKGDGDAESFRFQRHLLLQCVGVVRNGKNNLKTML